MIERIWHGYTEPADADEYERRLHEEIFPSFAERDVDGYRGYRVLRRDHDDEVEFVTVMRFDSLDAVRSFAGDAYETAHVPPEARELLTRWDDRATHYELKHQQTYDS